MSASSEKMTSSGVMGLPSWKRAAERSWNVAEEKSSGWLTHSAMSPYSVEGSSGLSDISES